jgi:periplasmic protein TonB
MAAVGYQLKSDLARVCLPAPGRAASQRLAWVNSIALLFLVIGVLGAQSRLPGRKAVPPLEQPVPIIIEPLPPVAPPTAESKPAEQQNDDDKPQVPSVQAVTLNTPAINFAVPTPGSLLVPMSVAPTPVEAPLKRAEPVRHEPATIQSTGKGGERPAPYPYPPIAAELGQQGTVVLMLTVDDGGRVVSAEIRESSGSPILDGNAQDWVKRRWVVPPVNGGHVFLAPIRYQLSSG